MEFWGVEVKSGQTVDVDIDDGRILHLSQASLGEIKSNKPSESVCLRIKVDNKALVLGTLNSEKLPQQLFDLVLDQEFQLSHNSKNGSVYFMGYITDLPEEEGTGSEESDSEDDEDLPLPIANVKQEVKKEEDSVAVKKEEKNGDAKNKDGNQKVKIVEPVKDIKDESDSDSDDSDSGSEDGDSDEVDDSSDSEDGSDEDEETPKKEQQAGKKRPSESALKTPATDKKAKMTTPQKTDGKKAVEHVATPHPSKSNKQPKVENKSNQKGSASSSFVAGEHACKPCSRNFKTDGALQSHNQAKHK